EDGPGDQPDERVEPAGQRRVEDVRALLDELAPDRRRGRQHIRGDAPDLDQQLPAEDAADADDERREDQLGPLHDEPPRSARRTSVIAAKNFSDWRVASVRSPRSTGIVAVIRPGRGDITTTPSDRHTASGIEWVTKTVLVPVFAQICSSSTCSRSRVISSRAPNGSSISSSGGCTASARAIATRCCMPPES